MCFLPPPRCFYRKNTVTDVWDTRMIREESDIKPASFMGTRHTFVDVGSRSEPFLECWGFILGRCYIWLFTDHSSVSYVCYSISPEVAQTHWESRLWIQYKKYLWCTDYKRFWSTLCKLVILFWTDFLYIILYSCTNNK